MKTLSPVLNLSACAAAAAATLLQAPFASAGSDRGGNGGVSIVCRNEHGAVESVQMLDLAEIPVPETDVDAMRQFNTALDRLRAAGEGVRADAIASKWRQLSRKIQFVKRDTSLASTVDANSVLGSDTHCKPEQLAAYRADIGALFIQPVLYEKLSPTHHAAMMLHAAIFQLVKRGDLDASSVSTRMLVRMLLDPKSYREQLIKAVQIIELTTHDQSAVLENQLLKQPIRPVACEGACGIDDVLGGYVLVGGDDSACDPAIQIARDADGLIKATIWWEGEYNLRDSHPKYLTEGGLLSYGISKPFRIDGAFTSNYFDGYGGVVDTQSGRLSLTCWKMDTSFLIPLPGRDFKNFELITAPQGLLQVVRTHYETYKSLPIQEHPIDANCLYERRGQ